ncbi:hypothetical protein NDU88_003186 [Pleurodeles waltl]|uniref:Uncharacterized protein n=1 Tax=Pleurodeles waltl TaxID=8319 RepID=A0AAV7NHI5_PLEWA|nr:hypothetical protein NDU88_003186 [Pleurodeles waltl]
MYVENAKDLLAENNNRDFMSEVEESDISDGNQSDVADSLLDKGPAADKNASRILTFHRKYDHMYVENGKELLAGNNNRDFMSEVEESDISDGNQSDVSDSLLDKGPAADKNANVEVLHTLSSLHDDIEAHKDPVLNLADLGIELDCPCPTMFKPKSVFLPAVQCEAIDVFEKDDIKQLKKVRYQMTKNEQNLTKVQSEALQGLKDDRSIVIRQSDKGGNAVVLDKDAYLAEGLRQVNDQTCYIPVNLMDVKKSNTQYLEMLLDWRDKGLLNWEE